MVQGTPQFTPAQVLEAGRRAEAEGKLDYAVQFYRHLATHYPSTSEAQTARDGLQRLAPHHASAGTALAGLNARPGDGAAPPLGSRPAHINGSGDGHHAPNGPPGLTGANIGGGAHGHAQPSPQARQAGPPPAPMGVPQRSAGPDPVASRGPRASDLPSAIDRYRAGRWLSRIFTVIGFGMAMVGLPVLLLALFGGMMPKVIDALPETIKLVYAFGTLVGPGMLVTGLTLAHWGQFARAAFDQANAAQDLVMIERTKLGR